MKTVEKHIKKLFGNNVAVAKTSNVGGGSVSKISLITLSDGKKLFLKQNSSQMKGMFKAELEGLKILAQGQGPRIPTPICFYEDENEQFLLMEYIEPGNKDVDYFRQFGACFAHLHKSNLGKEFGFDHNNYIGSTVQINTPTKSWIEFYRENRLGFQLNLLIKNDLATSSLRNKLEKLMDNLDRYLPEPEEGPTLLHGDLWAGNAIVGLNGEPVILDPAVYFGHREADLAMTELFGRFDQDFYDAYNDIWPTDSEYENRRDLYNLYHLLNHLNLFGSTYEKRILVILRQFV